MTKTAVVILNWNGKNFLSQFLPSVIQHSGNDARIFVADNASTDESVEFIQFNFPEVEIIQNADNWGFARGYNEALKKIEAEYFILLNSDVEVSENWIAPIINFMDKNPEIAACQPKIKSFKEKSHYEYAGAAGGFIDRYGFPFCRGRIFTSVEEDKSQYDSSLEVFWASGACMFIKAELFKKARGFDEDFFAHMEEVDLCWRLQNMGYRIFCYSGAEIYHVGAGTLAKVNARKTYLNFRNNLEMLYKNMPSGIFFKRLPVKLILDGIAGVRFIFTGEADHTLAVIKAHFYFYKNLGRLKRKKKIIAEITGDNYNKTNIFPGSIVLEYFVKRKLTFNSLSWVKKAIKSKPVRL
jgi:GT2 family glycosyltransferase